MFTSGLVGKYTLASFMFYLVQVFLFNGKFELLFYLLFVVMNHNVGK